MTLPEGWTTTTLGDCQGKTNSVDPRREPETEFDLFSVPAYNAYEPDRARGNEIGSTKQQVRAGDVLLCKIVPHIRRGWVVPPRAERPQIASGEWIVFRDNALEPEFLRRFVLSDQFHDQFMQTVSGVGGSLMRARPAEAGKIGIPVPPAAEQRRIVAKLDALTARLARARAELDRVPVLAANLRAAAVTESFQGTATTEYRAQSTDRAADDAHLASKYEAVAGRARRKPAAPIDWHPDMAIPSSWRWVSVDHVIARAQYGSSAKTSEEPGVAVLRMGNIQDGRIDFTKLKYLPPEHGEFPDLFLEPGDVIFNRTNSFELVGKSAVFLGADAPVSFASYLIRVQCCAIRPRLLAYYLNSAVGRQWVAAVASQQVGHPSRWSEVRRSPRSRF